MRRPKPRSLLFAAGLTLALAAVGAAAELEEAALLYRHGDLAGALQKLERLKADDEGPDAYPRGLLRGLVLLRLGRANEALGPLEAALKARPGDLDAHYNLGLAYQASARWGEAESAFQAANQAAPKRAEPLVALGALAAGRGEFKAAEQPLRAALVLTPDDPSIWAALADALIQQGDLKAGVQARARALELRPDEELMFRQAVALYSLGEWERAARALEQSGAAESPERYRLQGALAYRLGDLPEAQRQFKAALEIKPAYAEAQLDLAITHYDQRDYPAALTLFKSIKASSPAAAQARDYAKRCREAALEAELRRGSDAVLAGNFALAIQAWQRALEQADDKATVRSMIASLRSQQGPRAEQLSAEGEAALADGRLGDALQAWRHALEMDPGNRRAQAGIKAAAKDLAKLKAAYRVFADRMIEQEDMAGAAALALELEGSSSGAGKEIQVLVLEARQKQRQSLEAAARKALAEDRPQDALASLAQARAADPADPRLKAVERKARAALQKRVSTLLLNARREEAAGRVQSAYDAARSAFELAPEGLEARREAERLAKRLNLKHMGARDVDDLYYRGVYLYGAGDSDGALKLWRQGLEAAPSHRPLQQAIRTAEAKIRGLARLEKR